MQTTTIRRPYFVTEDEWTQLLDSDQPRCLGCAQPLPSTTWEPHGTCQRWYGAGSRVDYDAWCALVERSHDEPHFSRWADGAAMLGIPSRSTGTERVR